MPAVAAPPPADAAFAVEPERPAGEPEAADAPAAGPDAPDPPDPRRPATVAGPRRVLDARGRLVELDVAPSDRRAAIACHLLPLTALVLFPIGLAAALVPWLIGRDRSSFVDDHGRAALDASMSYGLWLLVTGLTVVGIVLWPVLIVVGVVSAIRAAIDASNGRYVRYPLALSILT